jgi:hypothetical protein
VTEELDSLIRSSYLRTTTTAPLGVWVQPWIKKPLENRLIFVKIGRRSNLKFSKKIEIKNSKKTRVHFKIFWSKQNSKNQSNKCYKIRRRRNHWKNQKNKNCLIPYKGATIGSYPQLPGYLPHPRPPPPRCRRRILWVVVGALPERFTGKPRLPASLPKIWVGNHRRRTSKQFKLAPIA